MEAILLPLGAMTALLAIWLTLSGVRNGFLFVLFALRFCCSGLAS